MPCVAEAADNLGVDDDFALPQAFLEDGLAQSWVPLLNYAEITSVLGTCRSTRKAVDHPAVWQGVATAWLCVHGDVYGDGRGGDSGDGVLWRKVCAQHELVKRAWRGSPTTVKLNVQEELRSQRLEDLEVLLVEFIAGDEGLALGHTKGAVSIWQIDEAAAFGDSSPASSSFPTPQARVAGVFKTSRRHDVQDLAVAPPAAAQPAALLAGRSVWVAAAVGANAYVWECTGRACSGQPASAALTTWELRATLRHTGHFSASHHGVFMVRITGSPSPCGEGTEGTGCAATVGEDGVLRMWRFGGDTGLEGEILWQHDVGDARQVVVCLLGRAGGEITAVARADQRTLQLFRTATGEALETIGDVWPNQMGCLPQSAAFDAGNNMALFSAITEGGHGSLAGVDLTGFMHGSSKRQTSMSMDMSAPAGHEDQEVEVDPVARGAPTGPLAEHEFSDHLGEPTKVRAIEGPLARKGRVARMVVPVSAAGVLLAVVHEGEPSVLLEVWERSTALTGGHLANPSYRGRAASLLCNQRLLAVGGRRVIVLDPSALKVQGILRVLEWRPNPRRSREAGVSSPGSRNKIPTGETSETSRVSRRYCECAQGVLRLVSGNSVGRRSLTSVGAPAQVQAAAIPPGTIVAAGALRQPLVPVISRSGVFQS